MGHTRVMAVTGRRPRGLMLVALVTACAVLSTACGAASDEASPPSGSPEGVVGGSATASAGDEASVPTSTAPSTSAASTTTAPPLDPHAFDAADAALRQRVAEADIAGGVLYVVRDGEVVHDQGTGWVGHTTPLQVASSAKWLTAATIMTLVDEGRLSLDEPISRWLPAFADDKAAITTRQLLDHTSGVPDRPCLWSGAGTLAACVDEIAAGPLQFAPGSAFSYGNASFHVAGRLIEMITGTSFPAAFAERIGTPLGMTSTSWGGGSNPSPAAGATTTLDDYARFLELMLHGGVYGGRRLLSSTSVAEIERDQVVGYDTSHDYSVGITRIPTYGLGLWRDQVDASDVAFVVSGNGGKGFYPWIDRSRQVYGIVAVQDDRGAEQAVPASRVVVDAANAALGPT